MQRSDGDGKGGHLSGRRLQCRRRRPATRLRSSGRAGASRCRAGRLCRSLCRCGALCCTRSLCCAGSRRAGCTRTRCWAYRGPHTRRRRACNCLSRSQAHLGSERHRGGRRGRGGDGGSQRRNACRGRCGTAGSSRTSTSCGRRSFGSGRHRGRFGGYCSGFGWRCRGAECEDKRHQIGHRAATVTVHVCLGTFLRLE